MPYIKLLFWSVLCLMLAFFLECGFQWNNNRIPGPGRLLNPTSGLWQNAWCASQFKNTTLNTQGLSEDVHILYDDRLVPHIYASNMKDALFAQGYVEAAHRLWQMDFLSREAGGRLSEVLGRRALQHDRNRLREGLKYGAEMTVTRWENIPETRAVMDPYIQGVNAFIDQLPQPEWPVEFKLLEYSPEAWTALKSALIYKSMTSTLASYNEDIQATNTMLLLGLDTFRTYYPAIDPQQSPVIPGKKEYDFDQEVSKPPHSASGLNNMISRKTPAQGERGIGSNNWAVNARKVLGNYPILCNDPHLHLTLPSIWYELHIVTPGFNAYGVSIPGIPGIMIGFNEDIAWGNTNVGHDFVDFYKVEWIGDDRSGYRVGQEERAVQKRTEIIKVRNEENDSLLLEITDFGIIHPGSPEQGVPDLARDWIGYREHNLNETTVFVDAMRCRNYDEFKTATNEFFAPAQNFLFASRNDTVALRVNGNLPLKGDLQGRFIQEADPDQLEHNYIPREHNPEIINPERGFVSSANQVSTSEDYPYYYHGGFEEYRGIRLNDALEGMNDITIEDMKALQLDVYSLKADYFLAFMMQPLEDVTLNNNAEENAFRVLQQWDCNYDGTSKASQFFEKWFSLYRKKFWTAFFDLGENKNLLLPEDWVLIKTSRQHQDLSTQYIIESFREAAAVMDPRDLDTPWMQYRKSSINHLLRIPAFSYEGMPLGGCGDVLNAITGSTGPSWRMIVELDTIISAQGVFPGGQSGNPASKYYDDSMDEWVEGHYHTIDIYRNLEDLKEEALYSVKLKAQDQ